MKKPQTKPAAEAFEAPTTLDAALGVIEAMSKALDSVKDDLADLEQEAKDLRGGAADDAEKHAAEMQEELDAMAYELSVDQEAVMEMARIHQKLKAGREKEAAGDLDRLLQIVDCGGAMRTGACAVML